MDNQFDDLPPDERLKQRQLVLKPKVGVPALLILVEDDDRTAFILSGDPHPHVALGSGRAAIPVDLTRCLICLDDMALKQFPVHAFVKPSEVSVGTVDYPLTHQLS